jgi:ribonuclease Z
MKGEIIYKKDDFNMIKPPRKYAYCSDTKFDKEIVSHIANADLLYHESTFMEAERERATLTSHSTTTDAATIGKMAQVKQLLLGHYSVRYFDLNPLLEEAKKTFEPSMLSEEGKTYEIR